MTAGYSRHLFICHRQTLDEFSNRLINHRITQELAVPCEKRALRFIDIRLGRLNQTIAGINQQHGKGIGRGAVAFFGEFHKDALDPLRIAVHCTRKRQLRHTGRSRCSSAREFAKQRKPCEEIVSELI